MNRPDNQALVIFGASGDLATRKLIPSVFELYMNDSLPEGYAVLGVSRTDYSSEAFREKMRKGILQYSKYKEVADDKMESFLQMLHYISIDTQNGDDYAKVKAKLKKINQAHNLQNNYIFYLSTPPQLYHVIPKFLYAQGLTLEHKGFRRIIIEKPFGNDLQSALQLNKRLLDFFNEDQIFRIDHYLGKETVQNLMVTRFANGIFEPLWNHNFIQHVEITAAESIGVEGRGGYYENAGALRDMVQNHLLQIASLVAMEPPAKINSEEIRHEKLKVFRSMRPLSKEDLKNNVIRGQYMESHVRGELQKAYRDEEGVDPNSRTETYFAMKFFIDNWRWSGVPFYIRTGKRLPTRVSEIVIHFKPSPAKLFTSIDEDIKSGNKLIMRIQPDEGILLKTGLKVPGKGYEVKSVNVDFHYADIGEVDLPDAYERLILDSMMGDNTLFMSGDGAELTWEFVQPIIDYWDNTLEAPLYGYPSGSWGPETADDLIEGNQTWRYPCKNLADDGLYCEL